MNLSKQINFRRQILLLILLVVTCVLLGGCAKKTQKVYRVGVLSGLNYIADITDGFKSGMTELGYVEGKNIVYDVQKTNFDMVRYRNILQKFVDDEVNLIFVFPTEASLEAKAITEGTDIPVVFSFASIEGTGLVNSVREPGGHITGVRYPSPELCRKDFEILRELFPEAKRVLIPYQRGYPIVALEIEAIHQMAEASNIALIELPADDAAEIQAELDTRAKSVDIGVDVILCVKEPLLTTPDAFAVIDKFAAEHKLPLVGGRTDYGSIFGMNAKSFETGKQAAFLADKILSGTPAGTIPVMSAEMYLTINYKAAKEFGINVSEGLLARADEIIR